MMSGEKNPQWKGGRTVDSSGYVLIKIPSHPRAMGNGYVFEHILVCEKALGKPLPHGAVPHHHDGNQGNNAPSNLVVCQDLAYHNLLHQRQRALEACGNVHWRKCPFCKKYDAIENLQTYRGSHYHRSCGNEHKRKHYISKGERDIAGEKNGRSILLEEDVKKIRTLFSMGCSRKELFAMYPVSQVTINRIINRKMWKHI